MGQNIPSENKVLVQWVGKVYVKEVVARFPQKGILSHDAPLTRANELPSRPGCPDAARSRQLREIPRCATLPGEHLPGSQGDAFWC